MKVKRMVLLALLAAIALTIWIVEAQIPLPIAIAGVKIGLANIVTLVTIKLFGRRDALLVLLVRIVLGALVTANPAALLYSLGGGLCCFVIVSVTGALPLWVRSVLGAIAHNAAQLALAALVTQTSAVWLYAPPLCIAAIVSGAFTGLCAEAVLRRSWFKNFFS